MELAGRDPRVVCVCAAPPADVGLSDFEKSYFLHFYDAGVADGHAVTFAAGLALGGIRPFVFSNSAFLQRAYDQIMLEVGAHRLPVVFMVDRAGNTGRNSEEYHGLHDLSFLRNVSGMTIMAPKDTEELKMMARFALTLDGPAAIRYPAGEAPMLLPTRGSLSPLEKGVSERLTGFGSEAELFAIGNMVQTALEAAALLEKNGIGAGVVNARFAAPIDKAAILEAAGRGSLIVTLEDNALSGGFGESVCAALTENGLSAPTLLIGWPDGFEPDGDGPGLSPEGIACRIQEHIGCSNNNERAD